MSQDLLENCSECYHFALSEFPPTIYINGNLTANTAFYFKFTDKFQNSYVTKLLTTGAQGEIKIDIDDENFPNGLPPEAWFNKNAGLFIIEASLDTDLWEPAEFTFQSVTYQCIVVEFFNDNSEKNTIE